MNRSKLLFSLVGTVGVLVGLQANAEPPAASPATATTSAQAAAPAPAAPQAPAPETMDQVIAWDAQIKELVVTNGTANAMFTFNLTNISSHEVVITGAASSCFCTVAQLPENPWTLKPGATGQITANMNLAGKSGPVTKTITVSSKDQGIKQVYVKVTILPPAPAGSQGMNGTEREINQKLALADRQAVFKGTCVQCHAEPAKGLVGKELFAKACGVCHEGENRNPMVPDLHNLAHETNAEYWKNWIAHGKPGSLMPAFAANEGGILSENQMTSLVTYLTAAIPNKPAASLRSSVQAASPLSSAN